MDKTPEPEDADEKGPRGYWGYVVCLFVIFVFYVLSSGPVMRYCSGSSRKYDALNAFYQPVGWLYEHTPLHKPLGIYFHWWLLMWFDKNGDIHPIPVPFGGG